MTFKGQVTRGLKWQAIKIAGKQSLSLVVFTTLARILDPSAFGLVALIGVYSFFTSMLADFGIGAALVQRQNLEKAHLDTAFWFNIGFNALLCATTILLAEPIALLMGEPQLAPLLRWSSLGLLFGALSSIQGILFVKDMDFRRPTLRLLIGNSVGGAVGVGMALGGYGVWALVGQLLVGNLAGCIFLCAASPYRPSFTFSPKHLRDLLGVGSSVFANALICFVSSRLDQLIIGRLAGVPALGLYVIANKLPEMVKSATLQPVEAVCVPALARLQDDPTRMRNTIYRGMELNAVVMFPLFSGIAIIAGDLVPFLFGAKWALASGLCSLLALYALVNSLQVLAYPALLATGVTGKYVLLNLAHAFGVLVACVAGIRFGVSYLVVGLTANSLVMSIPSTLLLRRRIGLSPAAYSQPCLVPACASLVMVVLVWATRPFLPLALPIPLKLGVEIALGAIGYVGFIYLFKRTILVNLAETVRYSISRKQPPLAATAPAPEAG